MHGRKPLSGALLSLELITLAPQHRLTAAQLSLAMLLRRPEVDSLIIGGTSVRAVGDLV